MAPVISGFRCFGISEMDLNDFFNQHANVAIAFSGGVDSAYLLYSAVQAGVNVKAYYVKSDFQPEFELQDARRLARDLGARLQVLYTDVLCDKKIMENPRNRCYYCKQQIFGQILQAAAADGFTELLDGTNASDQCEDRPGMRALQELKVLSPLRLCGLTKAEIRQKSRDAGLFTWNKPAYACLATRTPFGEPITKEKLERTQWAESYLAALGFRDFRIRGMENVARLQIRAEDLGILMEKRMEITKILRQHYSAVLLDLEMRSEQ